MGGHVNLSLWIDTIETTFRISVVLLLRRPSRTAFNVPKGTKGVNGPPMSLRGKRRPAKERNSRNACGSDPFGLTPKNYGAKGVFPAFMQSTRNRALSG
jgi:hypothetical protein